MARDKSEILERKNFSGCQLSIKYLNLHCEASENFQYTFLWSILVSKFHYYTFQLTLNLGVNSIFCTDFVFVTDNPWYHSHTEFQYAFTMFMYKNISRT
jgi:hypothetical protein